MTAENERPIGFIEAVILIDWQRQAENALATASRLEGAMRESAAREGPIIGSETALSHVREAHTSLMRAVRAFQTVTGVDPITPE